MPHVLLNFNHTSLVLLRLGPIPNVCLGDLWLQHCQHNYLGCLHSRWDFLAAPWWLHPNLLIQGINQGQGLAWIYFLGCNCLWTAIQYHLGFRQHYICYMALLMYQRDMCHQEIQHSSLSKILCLKPALIHPQKNTSWALCKRCCGLLNTLGQILHLLWIFYLSSFVIHQKHTGNPVCACWTSWESTSDLSLSLGGHADISGYSH